MNGGVSAKVIAALCGLAGFAIAVVAGITVDNPADIVITRALIALIACNLMGWAVGLVLERVFRDAVAAHQRAVDGAAVSKSAPSAQVSS